MSLLSLFIKVAAGFWACSFAQRCVAGLSPATAIVAEPGIYLCKGNYLKSVIHVAGTCNC